MSFWLSFDFFQLLVHHFVHGEVAADYAQIVRHVFSSELLQPGVNKLRALPSDLILNKAELHYAIVSLLNGLQ